MPVARCTPEGYLILDNVDDSQTPAAEQQEEGVPTARCTPEGYLILDNVDDSQAPVAKQQERGVPTARCTSNGYLILDNVDDDSQAPAAEQQEKGVPTARCTSNGYLVLDNVDDDNQASARMQQAKVPTAADEGTNGRLIPKNADVTEASAPVQHGGGSVGLQRHEPGPGTGGDPLRVSSSSQSQQGGGGGGGGKLDRHQDVLRQSPPDADPASETTQAGVAEGGAGTGQAGVGESDAGNHPVPFDLASVFSSTSAACRVDDSGAEEDKKEGKEKMLRGEDLCNYDRPLNRQGPQRESQRYSQLRASVDDLYQDFEEVV